MTADTDQFPLCRERGLTIRHDRRICYVTWADLQAMLRPAEYAELAQPFFGQTVAMYGPYASDVEAWLKRRERNG